MGHVPDRLHALDAIRAAALLLGICLHACLSFVPGLDTNVWPINDVHKSTTLGVTLFVIHIFRMSVFFLMAGLLTRSLFHRRSLLDFCRNRAARILVPLALGWATCFILVVGVFLWALARSNGGQLPDPLPKQVMDQDPNFMHLWFLYVLLWMYFIVIAGCLALRVLDPRKTIGAVADQLLRVALSSYAGPVLLAVPVVVALSLIPDWIGWLGVPTPGHTLVPPAIPLFIYTYLFAIGWMLDRQRHLLNELARRWPFNLSLGLMGTLVCLHLTGIEATFAAIHDHKQVYAAAYGIALICWTFAFIGLGMRFLNRGSTIIRYASDASYWMYIAHLPVVLALQTAFMLADLHWTIKFCAINVLSFVFLLVTYHYWVRSTWIGRMLNGRKEVAPISSVQRRIKGTSS